MLIEFSVSNHRSINEPVTFSMVAAKINAKYKQIDENNVVQVDDDLSLLRSAAIYGANASGKSNFISAVRFMKWFVVNSSRETQVNDLIDVEPFRLSTNMEDAPSCFEIVFLLDNTKYRYGFEVNLERVVSEWLYYVPTVREARLFEREEDNIVLSTTFKEGRGLKEKTRENALFLSVAAQFNGPVARRILEWFGNLHVISGLEDVAYRGYTMQKFEDSHHKSDIVRLVKKLDLGIDDIQVEKVSVTPDSLPRELPEELRNFILNTKGVEELSVRTVHRKFNDEGKPISVEIFDIDDHESEGTKKLFSLAGPLMDTLRNGKVLLVDELDARLHPLITCAIISLFNSKETNPRNAQLIFTTHDTNLLNNRIFRRDQIWFAEKDRRGSTHLYSLVEYKVRNDASFESDYIRGKYGAIPFLGDLSRLAGGVDA